MPKGSRTITEQATAIAQKTFGYEKLKPEQATAIESIVSGKDTLVLAPTSFGKSAIFQIPAMMTEGTMIVVSPLIALMKDQVDKLQRWGISAVRLSSDMDEEDVRRIIRRMGSYNMVYVAPERVKSSDFINAVGRTTISIVAVDEAHVLSHSMRDFRPAYATLGTLLATKLSHVPRLAVTATADSEVEKDVTHVLGMKEYTRIVISPVRPNLNYEVVQDLSNRQLFNYIHAKNLHRVGRGIVYASTRHRVTEVAKDFTSYGLPMEAYHAGLGAARRTEVQNRFMRNQQRHISATNAFGMGVDAPDVRFVVHADPAGSIHEYLQEAGRAGRDGKPSTCLLNITTKGIRSRRFFIKASNPPLEVFDAIWTLWKGHRVRDVFETNTFEITGVMFGCGANLFEAPYYVDSAMSYLEYVKAINAKTEKTVYTFKKGEEAELLAWRRKFPRNIRVDPSRNRVVVTVLSNEEDFTNGMLASHAVSVIDDQRPVKHFSVQKLRDSHDIRRFELDEKRAAAETRLQMLLDFANSPDKAAYIARVFQQATERPPQVGK